MTVTLRSGLNTGIQRVVRSLGSNFPEGKIACVMGSEGGSQSYVVLAKEDLKNIAALSNEPNNLTHIISFLRNIRIIRYLLDQTPNGAKYKEFFKETFLNNSIASLNLDINQKIKIQPYDIYITFDAFWSQESDLQRIVDAKLEGAKIVIFVHDVLPITNPEWFEEQSVKIFRERFVTGIKLATSLLFSTEYVRDLTTKLLDIEIASSIVVLGSNLETDFGCTVENELDLKDCFLMLGTLEPRKNYEAIIHWHMLHWRDRNLVIVGRKGWLSKPIIKKIKKSRASGAKIHWFSHLSDREVRALITSASLGICASLDEGYGLPLREFLKAKLPVVASDIPVFREVTGEGVFFFDPVRLANLNSAVSAGLLFDRKKITTSFPTWEEAAFRLIKDLEEIKS